MDKLRRAGVCLAAVIIGTLSFPEQIWAAGWQQDSGRWWYENSDGSYPADQWQYIDDYWYYFYGDGYMAHDCWIGNYYVGSSGAMLTDTVTPDGYQVGADGAWIPDTGNDYSVFKELLAQQTNKESFALYDIDLDGTLELITLERYEGWGRRLISIFDLQSQDVYSRVLYTEGDRVAVLPGSSIFATWGYFMEFYQRCIIDVGNNYTVVMKDVHGESDDAISFGSKEQYQYIVTEGMELQFVSNDSQNREQYIEGMQSTGFMGKPLDRQGMGWLDNFF